VSEQHFMTLINTRVRVVLDVTESNKNFPLIIIIIREPYIIAKVTGRGEYNSVILYCYYYAMSERIKALARHGNTIYTHTACVYTRFNQKHISCGFKSVVSQRPPPTPP